MPISRRRFIAMSGVGYGVLSHFGASNALAAVAGVGEADLVVFNARVYTLDARAPTAEAFAVKGGRFIAVGTNANIRGLIGKRTEALDAQHMTVVPGLSFIDAGIVAVAGSDFDPGPFAPLMGMQGMVTRTGWNGEVWGANQRITVDEALRINTQNGAYATREESLKGSIEAGKLADFVVLSEDPHAVDPSKIKDIEVVRTVVGGTTSYRA